MLKSLQTSSPVRVAFPIVGGSHADMAFVRCQRAATDNHALHAICRLPNKAEEVQKLLEVARSRFDDGPGCIEVSFSHAEFSGQSYGVALCLADRLLARAPAAALDVTATGTIGLRGPATARVELGRERANPSSGARGRDALEAKLDVVVKHAKAGSWFVLPGDALAKASPAAGRLLATLTERGVKVRGVDRLEQVDSLVDEMIPAARSRAPGRSGATLRQRLAGMVTPSSPLFAPVLKSTRRVAAVPPWMLGLALGSVGAIALLLLLLPPLLGLDARDTGATASERAVPNAPGTVTLLMTDNGMDIRVETRQPGIAIRSELNRMKAMFRNILDGNAQRNSAAAEDERLARTYFFVASGTQVQVLESFVTGGALGQFEMQFKKLRVMAGPQQSRIGWAPRPHVRSVAARSSW